MNDDRNSKPLAELVRDRLFRMSPEYWTEKHLEWVGCRFDDVENEELSEGSPQSDVSAIVRGIKKMSEKLNQSGQWAKNIVEEPNADKKTRNMTNLLSQVYSRTFLKRRLVPLSPPNSQTLNSY